MRRTPLSRGTKPLARRTKLRRGRWSKQAARERRALRKAERWRCTYGPPGFAEFVRSLPCVLCTATPSVPHHDPTRKSGGTWTDVSPVCERCHNNVRHGLYGGVKTFWAAVGMDYAESNKRTQIKWLAFRERERAA